MMKIAGRVLLGLGAFLLVMGLVAAFWAPGMVKKTPTDVNRLTYLSGEASKQGAASKPIYAISHDAVDSAKSTSSTVLWTSSSCVVFGTDATGGCLKANDPSTLALPDPEIFATDRTTALGVESSSLPANAIHPIGAVVNKFPFDTAQKTYPYWDNVVGKAVDAVYAGTQEIQGVKVYKYTVDTSKAPITIAKGIAGIYTDHKEIYVEPRTGAIVDQRETLHETLTDGSPAVDLTLGFTPDQVTSYADEAKKNIKNIDLLLKVVPIVGVVGGVLSLVVGALLLVLGRRRPPADAAPTEKPTVLTDA